MLVSQVLAEPMLWSESDQFSQILLRPQGLRIEGFNPVIPASFSYLPLNRLYRHTNRSILRANRSAGSERFVTSADHEQQPSHQGR